MLTIAIPTFNRNHLLRGALERLLPQLAPGHRLLIVDNHCDVPVAQTLESWLAEADPQGRVRIVRNPANVGGAANILRCLELCETRWLYCLGDDDLVRPDAIPLIERTLAEHPHALYVSFSRDFDRRKSTFTSNGLPEFAKRLDNWSSFLFMSTSVVNASEFRPHLRWGHLYAYSWAPLQAILLKLLNAGGEVVFSDRVICDEESLSDETWVPFTVAAGKMVLPELVDDPAHRRALACRLMAEPGPTSLVYWARAKADDAQSLARNRFFLELYLSRCLRYSMSLRLVAVRALAFVMLRPALMPAQLFRWLEAAAFRMMGRVVPSRRPMTDDRI